MVRAMVRTYTIIFVLFISIVLLATVYLSSSAFWGTHRPLQDATHSTAAEYATELVQESEFLDQRQSKSVSKEEGIIRTNRTKGYLIARLYEQQMTAGLNDFFQLSNIAVRLNLSTVEPFVQDSHIKGIPDTKQLGGDNRFWKLSEFYDLHYLQTILNNCSSLRQLVSFDTMLMKAPRDVVLVYFLTWNYEHFKQYFSDENHPPIVELDHKQCDYNIRVIHTMKVLNTIILHFSKLQNKKLPFFTHSRAVLVDARSSQRLSLAGLTVVLDSIVSKEMNNSATLVFDRWRGIHNKVSKFFYFMPDFDFNITACGLHNIHHSKAVIKAAHNFSQSLNQSRPVIGVHIRGERVLIDTKGNFSHCFQQLTTLLQTLTSSSKIPNERVKVFHDLGYYGTMSCTHEPCLSGRSKLLSQINALGYPVNLYDPAMLNSVPVSPAFASFVEREYLAHVDILVTVGRGGFQQSIVERFLKSPGSDKDNLHRLCLL